MTEKTLRGILSSFRDRRILVIGDVMLDEYVWGDVRRVSPEAPVPVVEVNRRSSVPGGAGNTAANIASLGGHVSLGGVVGRDMQSGPLREALTRAGVEVGGLIVDDERPTTTKLRVVAHNQQVVRVDSEMRTSLAISLQDELLNWAAERVRESDVCVISDYDKGVVTTRLAERFIAMARDAGKPVVVDPKGTNFAKYRGSAVVTPNTSEVERVLGHEMGTEEELLSGGRQLLEILNGSPLLITRGAHGMSLLRRGGPATHIASEARHVFDVTGAGDTVVSVLALALSAGVSLEDGARLANYAAGIVVGKLGTYRLTVDDLLAAQPSIGPEVATR